jgi:UDP-glucose 4-epimerase
MKILVTGGAGFIGSHIADRLLAAGHEVAVLDNLSTGRRHNVPAAARLIELDLRSDETAAHLRTAGYQVLVHEAAQIDVRASVARPDVDADVNVRGLVQVVEATRLGGRLQHIVFASSGGAIYGEQDAFPATEDHAIRPESPYGVAKRCGELYLEWYQRAYRIPVTLLRYANVYGPRQDPLGEAGVVAIFAARLLRGQPCTVYGDGGQTRDFVYVGDVAEANMRALERGATGAINIGTGVETSVLALYQRMAALAGVTTPPRHEVARPGEQRRSVIAPARCGQLLGFTPATPLAQGLATTLDHFRRGATAS